MGEDALSCQLALSTGKYIFNQGLVNSWT
jgi:hypothetical protein